MKLILFTTLLIVAVAAAVGQEATKSEVFQRVEIAPEFEGGMPAFHAYLEENLTYPEDARKEKTEGRVFIQFVIDEEGNISANRISIMKGTYPFLDAEALRLIKRIPGMETRNA